MVHEGDCRQAVRKYRKIIAPLAAGGFRFNLIRPSLAVRANRQWHKLVGNQRTLDEFGIANSDSDPIPAVP